LLEESQRKRRFQEAKAKAMERIPRVFWGGGFQGSIPPSTGKMLPHLTSFLCQVGCKASVVFTSAL